MKIQTNENKFPNILKLNALSKAEIIIGINKIKNLRLSKNETQKDLADALNKGVILAAGLDVLSLEPPTDDNPLLTAKNCYITPHIAWATKEARCRLMNIAVDNLKSFIAGKIINNVAK